MTTYEHFEFKIIGMENCGWCEKALKLIADKLPGAKIDYRDYKKNPDSLQELRDFNFKTVPQIWVTEITGFSTEETQIRMSMHIGGYEALEKWINPRESLSEATWAH